MQSWATLPFDNPLNTYVAVYADTGKSRVSTYGAIWWLGYRNNVPVELIKSRFKSVGKADAYREELKYLLAHCETGATIYLPARLYDYANSIDKDTQFMLTIKKAEIKELPPHVLWDIMKQAVKEDLDKLLESEEKRSWQYITIE